MSDRQLTLYRRHHVGFVFQFYNLMPSLTAYENVELVTEIADNPLEAGGGAFELVGSGRAHGSLSGPAFRWRAAARRHRQGDCQTTDRHCSATSRPVHSTARLAASVLKVLQDVNDRLGATVLIITHAAATAAMADRVIGFSDGRIRDVTVNETKKSAEEIEW